MHIIYCQCCGKQLVQSFTGNSKTVSANGAIRMVKGFCCHICARDLDKDGNFPEERF